MFYVLMVSHGEFAPGLHTAVKMIAGDRDTVLSTSLKDGMGADEYAANVEKLVANITPEDKLVVLADIMGGSPLTTAMNVLAEKGLLANTKAFTGMNLPMALTVILAGEGLEGSDLSEAVLGETRTAVQEFVIPTDDEDEEDL
ncbi:MAG: PTS fructose transporter subunit IIA [Selenomonadales bacterium]|nr:PTS fructose transporter subunit IIA [Selenomonadales bacterium]MDY3740133.1 PTS fructose transporter subunit IIA [Selenomonadaceae bacterium]MEE1362761.1 PTS fructose transporter subunit IIA [Selenomonadaceae bacterium]